MESVAREDHQGDQPPSRAPPPPPLAPQASGTEWVQCEGDEDPADKEPGVQMLFGINPAFGEADDFAERFATWSPESAGNERKIQPNQIPELLRKIESDPSCMEVVGFNEFPYMNGCCKEKSHPQTCKDKWLIEREYWVRLDRVGKKLAGDDGFLIVHVHYAGKWLDVPNCRDRTVITQINFRHTTKRVEEAWHRKCVALNKMREKRGTRAVEIPEGGWKWADRPELSSAVHNILTKGEECNRVVKSLSDNFGAKFHHRRKALIWAVSEYDSEIRDLPNAISDGVKLRDLLVRFGWDVQLMLNVSKQEAEESLDEFISQLKEEQVDCIFAFVGHGLQFSDNDGTKHYLVPKDAKIYEKEYQTSTQEGRDLDSKCIPFGYIQKMIKEAWNHADGQPLPASLFILDCCRNSLSGGGGNTRAVTRPAAENIKCGDLENSCIMYSTTSGSTASDGNPGEGGPFMSALIEAAKKQGASIFQIHMEIQNKLGSKGGFAQLSPIQSLLKNDFFLSIGSEEHAIPQTPPESSGTPTQGWQRIKEGKARHFWQEYFDSDELVEWVHFKAAVVKEYPDLDDESKLENICREIDRNKDGNITLIEFNIFTKKGFESALRIAAEKEQPYYEKNFTMPEQLLDQGQNAPQGQTGKDAWTDHVDPDGILAQGVPVTFPGVGKFLGGSKTRDGILSLERGRGVLTLKLLSPKEGLKFNENVCKCLLEKVVNTSANLEVQVNNLAHMLSFGNEQKRDKWLETLNRLKECVKKGDRTKKEDFIFSDTCVLLAVEKLSQVLFLSGHNPAGHPIRTTGFIMAKRPLSKEKSYFEIHVREGGPVGLGIGTGAHDRAEGIPGQLPEEVGYFGKDGSIYTGSGDAEKCLRTFAAGDRVGCGIAFERRLNSDDSEPDNVYFFLNDRLVHVSSCPRKEAYPIIGFAEKFARVDILLDQPAPDLKALRKAAENDKIQAAAKAAEREERDRAAENDNIQAAAKAAEREERDRAAENDNIKAAAKAAEREERDRAAENAKKQAAGRLKNTGDLKTILRTAISKGVPLFNKGDKRGCTEVYRKAAQDGMNIAPQEARTRLSRAISEADEASNAGDGAWALRHAFDAILSGETTFESLPSESPLRGARARRESREDEFDLFERLFEKRLPRSRASTSSSLKVGSQVCIDGEPQCGWGKAHPWSVGKLREIDDDIFVVDFPEHKSWKGYADDLRVFSGEPPSTANVGKPSAGINKYGFVRFCGGQGSNTTIEFTGSERNRKHIEYGFVRGDILSRIRPYFELTIVVPRDEGIGIGLCGTKVFVGAMPGWPSFPSLGYHSDDGCLFLQDNEGQGLKFGPECRAGDRMGCGLLFSSSGEAETAYFTRNGEIIGWVPVPSADLVYPMVAATAPGVVRLDFAAPAPSVPPACKIGARTFSNLALAASAARKGDLISVSRGLHALAEGLKIRKDITIQGKGEQQTVLRLYGRFIVTSTSAKVVIQDMSLESFGGDADVGFDEKGAAGCVCAREGNIFVESCKLTSDAGSGIVATTSCDMLRVSKSEIGPCGRHGVVLAGVTKDSGSSFESPLFRMGGLGLGSMLKEMERQKRGQGNRYVSGGKGVLSELKISGCKIGVAVNEEGDLAMTKCVVTGCKNGLFSHPAKALKVRASSFDDCDTAITSQRSEAHDSTDTFNVECQECSIKNCKLGLKVSSETRDPVWIHWDLSNTMERCRNKTEKSGAGYIKTDG